MKRRRAHSKLFAESQFQPGDFAALRRNTRRGEHALGETGFHDASRVDESRRPHSLALPPETEWRTNGWYFERGADGFLDRIFGWLQDRDWPRVESLVDLEPVALAQVVCASEQAAERFRNGTDLLRGFLLCLQGLPLHPDSPLEAALVAIVQDDASPLAIRTWALQRIARSDDARRSDLVVRVVRDLRWEEVAIDGLLGDQVDQLGAALWLETGQRTLLRLLADPAAADSVVRRLASRFSAEGADEERVVFAVLKRWFHPTGDYNEVTAEALRRCCRFPRRVDSSVLTRAARSAHYAEEAVVAIGSLRDPQHLPLLGECLAADWIPDPARRESVQGRTAWALTEYMSDEAAQILLSGVSAVSSEEVRALCFEGVETIRRYREEEQRLVSRREEGGARSDTIAQLVSWLEERDPERRAAAARELRTQEVAAILIELGTLLVQAPQGTEPQPLEHQRRQPAA